MGYLKTKNIGNWQQTYNFDVVNGNLMERGDINTGLDQRITYNSYNKATSICEGSDSLVILYGPDRQRAASVYYESSILTRTIYYFGDYEMEVTPTDTIHRYYIRSTTGIAALKVKSGTTDSLYYAGTDHLGSIIALYRNDGSVKEEYSFDAWGRRRNPADWSYNNVPAPTLTERGFTGHEHLDDFGLINMNGRLYDPVLGRFLNADPVIQFPWFTQSFNSYSYVLNNPLIYVDPSGYSASEATEYPDPYYAYQQWTKIHGYGLGYADFADQFWDNIYKQEANGRWLLNGLGYGSFSMTFTWSTLEDNPRNIKDYERLVLIVYPSIKVKHSATIRLPINYAQSGGGHDAMDYRAAGIGAVNTYTGVTGDAFYSNYHWMQKSGKLQWNSASKQANYLYKQSNTIVKGITKNARLESRGSGVLGSAVSAYQFVSEPTYANAFDAVMGATTFIPVVGWAISGTYFISNIITEAATGKSIGEHLFRNTTIY